MTARDEKGRFARSDTPAFQATPNADRVEAILARPALPADTAALVAHLSGEGEA